MHAANADDRQGASDDPCNLCSILSTVTTMQLPCTMYLDDQRDLLVQPSSVVCVCTVLQVLAHRRRCVKSTSHHHANP